MDDKENRRVKLTKKLLKESLIEIMHSKPMNKITIKEICETADINRSTFYLHYVDQYALLNDIEKELFLHAQQHLEKIDSNYSSMQYLEALLSYIKDNTDIFKTLLCQEDNLAFQTEFIEASLKNLKANLVLNCSERISGYVYNYLIMGCLSIIKRWIGSDYDMSSKDMANLIFHLSDKAASAFK